MAKNSKIGADVISSIPTVRDSIFVVKKVKDVEIPSSLKTYDTEKIRISKVEETSREQFVRVNGEIDVRIEPKTNWEIGEPMRTEEEAKILLIKSLKEEQEKAEKIKKQVLSFIDAVNKIIDKIESDGLSYAEDGKSITIDVIVAD